MLTIGRTLMGNPELLLVDEPTEGLAPLLVDMVVEILRGIHEEGGFHPSCGASHGCGVGFGRPGLCDVKGRDRFSRNQRRASR